MPIALRFQTGKQDIRNDNFMIIKIKSALFAIFSMGLSFCLVHAGGFTNSSINQIRKIGDYTMMRGTNGHWNFVHPDEFWNGAWKEGVDGWRVQLRVYMQTNYWIPKEKICQPVSTNLILSVQWGSAVRDSGDGYYMTPNGKFAKFELLDAKGNILPPNPYVGTNILIERYNWYCGMLPVMSPMPNQSPPKILYETNLPAWASPAGSPLVSKFPKIITTDVYPRQYFTGIIGKISCVTNQPPSYLGFFKLDEIYSVTNEGDYMLTVQPVLYRKRIETNILDRLDLPSVTTKVHLVPNAK